MILQFPARHGVVVVLAAGGFRQKHFLAQARQAGKEFRSL